MRSARLLRPRRAWRGAAAVRASGHRPASQAWASGRRPGRRAAAVAWVRLPPGGACAAGPSACWLLNDDARTDMWAVGRSTCIVNKYILLSPSLVRSPGSPRLGRPFTPGDDSASGAAPPCSVLRRAHLRRRASDRGISQWGYSGAASLSWWGWDAVSI